jgi:hypothetical protein
MDHHDLLGLFLTPSLDSAGFASAHRSRRHGLLAEPEDISREDKVAGKGIGSGLQKTPAIRKDRPLLGHVVLYFIAW